MLKAIPFLIASLLACPSLHAQTLDTITTKNQKIVVKNLVPIKHSYAVFFTDSIGNRTSSADIWDREIRRAKNSAGQDVIEFEWKMWRKDSLFLQTKGVCAFPSLELLEYTSAPMLAVKNTEGILNVRMQTRMKTDTTFAIPFDGTPFTFPMDLEIWGLLPIKYAGQKFSVPFYEPGRGSYKYYTCTVVGKEQLVLQGTTGIDCWMLQIDYGQSGSYATFWIAQDSGEVLKMQESFRGVYRYKIKLFSDNSANVRRIPKM